MTGALHSKFVSQQNYFIMADLQINKKINNLKNRDKNLT